MSASRRAIKTSPKAKVTRAYIRRDGRRTKKEEEEEDVARNAWRGVAGDRG